MITFDKYIDNPGAGTSVVTNRQIYKTMYKTKFDAVLLRENGKIEYKVFKKKDKNDTYYIYLKIPSEVISHFYYDVVIQLYTDTNTYKNEANLRRYGVKFYSNDPAFMYTFAHAFVKNKLFIDDLKSKMSKQALSNVASVKNPKDNVWYVKSLYFAYLAMEKYHLFNRSILDKEAQDYKKDSFKDIVQAEQKVKLRQEAGEKKEKEEKESNKKQPPQPRQNVQSKNIKNVNKITPNRKITKKTKIVKKI